MQKLNLLTVLQIQNQRCGVNYKDAVFSWRNTSQQSNIVRSPIPFPRHCRWFLVWIDFISQHRIRSTVFLQLNIPQTYKKLLETKRHGALFDLILIINGTSIMPTDVDTWLPTGVTLYLGTISVLHRERVFWGFSGRNARVFFLSRFGCLWVQQYKWRHSFVINIFLIRLCCFPLLLVLLRSCLFCYYWLPYNARCYEILRAKFT